MAFTKKMLQVDDRKRHFLWGFYFIATLKLTSLVTDKKCNKNLAYLYLPDLFSNLHTYQGPTTIQ